MISNYLKEYFEKHEIKQEEVTRVTGISRSKISLFLNKKRKITAEELVKIAIAYNIDLNKIKEIIKKNP